MQVSVAAGTLTEQAADTLVVLLPQATAKLTGDAAALDSASGGGLARMLAAGQFAGKRGDVAWVPTAGRGRTRRAVLLGTGDPATLDANALRVLLGNFSRRLRDLGGGGAAISLDGLSLDAETAGEVAAEGLILGLYRFDRHHTRAADRPANTVETVTLVAGAARRATAVQRGVTRGAVIAEAQNLARDLGNEPANLMTPTILAARAQQLAAEVGLECTIIERAEAERLGMGSYLSVSNGSQQPPKFIVLTWNGASTRGRYLGLIGKGITFDTGGISLKPALDMDAMKGDMTGAASVIATLGAIARLRLPVNVMGIAPCTENMPSGSATKPGDVVYAMDGQSIEILNTDAEGRLVLADGLAYARANGCTTLVDVATLTGAIRVSLGSVRFGVFSNNDRLVAELERAGAAAGEKMWRLPMDEEYFELIKSTVADVKNTGGAPAGSITAAKFIELFAHDTPWVHLDIAAVMASEADRGVNPKGNTGMPVRTLVHLAMGRARAK